MKKYALVITSVIAILLTQTGCRYEDGPNFTLRSADHRIRHTWVIENYYENETDKTTDFKNLFPEWVLIMNTPEKDGYSLVYATKPFLVSEGGTYEFLENGTKFNLKKDKTGTNIWLITKLTSKELWCEQKDGNGKNIRYHLTSAK